MGIIYRELEDDEIERIREIDRSELITRIYVYTQGRLEERSAFFDMKGFPEGELELIIERQKALHKAQGCVIGAFDGAALAAVASVENKIRGTIHRYCKMDILHVSKTYRDRGIASALIGECKRRAKAFGADRLYISATESKHTVDFYMKRGAVLVQEPDEELFRLEPLDIHLEMGLD